LSRLPSLPVVAGFAPAALSRSDRFLLPSSQSFLDGASFRGRIIRVPELKSSGCPRKCAAPAGFLRLAGSVTWLDIMLIATTAMRYMGVPPNEPSHYRLIVDG
jgi:hypothetical protein